MITYNDLVHDIKSLGVKEGDTLFLRISYKAIGKVENGPKTFLDALLSVVGENGTIILTAFPKSHNSAFRFFYRNKISSENNLQKPKTGIMPIVALEYPSSAVSKKLRFPFVVIGKHAKYLTENHTKEKEGYWLLREACEKFNSHCLRIGGESLTGTTHFALTDMLKRYNYYQMQLPYGIYVKENDKIKWETGEFTSFCTKAYKKMFDQLIYPNINKKEGKVGNGYAIITSMRETLEREREILLKNPKEILCDNSDCMKCRTSFTFSDLTKARYMITQLFKLKPSNIKRFLVEFRSFLLIVLFGKRMQ